MKGATKKTAVSFSAILAVAVGSLTIGGFFLGCQAQRSMHCESDVTGTTAHAECTATEAGELERP